MKLVFFACTFACARAGACVFLSPRFFIPKKGETMPEVNGVSGPVFVPNLVSNAVSLLSVIQSVSLAVVNFKGRPFMAGTFRLLRYGWAYRQDTMRTHKIHSIYEYRFPTRLRRHKFFSFETPAVQLCFVQTSWSTENSYLKQLFGVPGTYDVLEINAVPYI